MSIYLVLLSVIVVTRDVNPLAQLNVNPPIVSCDAVSVTFITNSDTQCQLDSNSFTDCKSPYHQSGLSRGVHSIRIKIPDGVIQRFVSFTIPGSYTPLHMLVITVAKYNHSLLTIVVLIY